MYMCVVEVNCVCELVTCMCICACMFVFICLRVLVLVLLCNRVCYVLIKLSVNAYMCFIIYEGNIVRYQHQ